MTALTAAQIRSGFKGKAVDLGPPPAPIQRIHWDTWGPCAGCDDVTERYGPHGQPLCTGCQETR